MIDTAELTEKLADVGPILGDALVAESEEKEAWQVVIEASQIMIECDHDRDCLVFSTEIGVPPEEKRDAFNSFALRVNSMWPFTGGVHLGLDADGEEFTLYNVLPYYGLDSQRLAAMLIDFAERRVSWAGAVAQGGPGDALPESVANVGAQTQTIIRG